MSKRNNWVKFLVGWAITTIAVCTFSVLAHLNPFASFSAGLIGGGSYTVWGILHWDLF